MIKHFNLNIVEKETNKKSYLNLKYKNRDDKFIEVQRKEIEYNYDLNINKVLSKLIK